MRRGRQHGADDTVSETHISSTMDLVMARPVESFVPRGPRFRRPAPASKSWDPATGTIPHHDGLRFLVPPGSLGGGLEVVGRAFDRSTRDERCARKRQPRRQLGIRGWTQISAQGAT